MKTLLIAAIALSFSPAVASTWCPVTDGNNATRGLPANSQVLLDAAGHISIIGAGFSAKCAPTELDNVRCTRDFTGPCSEPSQCEFRIWVTEARSKLDGIGIADLDIQHSDLSKAELWLVPEFSVYSELQFAPCPSSDEPATM